MEFQQRLQKAIERGQHASDVRAKADAQKALSEDELKRLHSQYRLEISEHIEKCLSQLPRHFPGFRFERIYGERGWGAAIIRDDLQIEGGKRSELFSRLEVSVRPVSALFVLELTGKGTIRNKEAYNRTYFQKLADVDPNAFTTLVDNWTLEYAEMYAAKQ